MRLFNLLWARLRGLVRRDHVIEDIDKELLVHIDMAIESLVEQGMSLEEARLTALKRFGNVGRIKDIGHSIRGGGIFETLWLDVKFGLRMLLKRPGFTIIATLTLALGIGANTAIFSVVDAVLLRPLPYADPDRLVLLKQTSSRTSVVNAAISPFEYTALREQNHVFSSFAAFANTGFNKTGGGDAERISGTVVTSDFFSVLGVAPAFGRTFVEGEDSPGHNQICILSDGLWQRDFGGDLNVIGSTMILNELPFKVVGVMPKGYSYPGGSDVWAPFALNPQLRNPSFLSPIARLKRDVSAATAAAESKSLLLNAAAGGPSPRPDDFGVSVTLLSSEITGDIRKPLVILVIAVALVLLIACANVANLYLSRAVVRTREIAVRMAIGATSARIVRQMLTESLLLAGLGAATGVALAAIILRFLKQLPVSGIPRIQEASLSVRALLFTAAVGVLTGIMFGVVPELRAKQLGIEASLREIPRGSATPASRRTNNTLLVAQVALSMTLLVAAGLLLRSFQRILAIDPGFNADSVVTARLSLPRQKYPTPVQVAAFYDRLLERVKAIPGVKDAAINSNPPFTGLDHLENYVVERQEPAPDGVVPSAHARFVSPGLFESLGTRLSYGRDFSTADRDGSQPVVILDDTFARQYWPQGNALGKRIRVLDTSAEAEWRIVVGVVSAVRHFNLTEKPEPYVYLPQMQQPQSTTYLVIRTTTEQASVVSSVRSELKALDPNLPLHLVRTLPDLVGQTLDSSKLVDLLLTFFALLAVTLASVGIYGAMSLYVNSRIKEFGIRLAIGAQPRALMRYVLRQGLSLVVIGLVFGTCGALLFSRAIASMLFGVGTTDPIVFLGVPLFLVTVAFGSCYLPARKAMRVDPLLALRDE